LLYVKKAIMTCYAVQASIIFLLVFGAILSTSGIVAIRLTVWHIPIIYFLDLIGCMVIFHKAFKRGIKEVSPNIYKNLYLEDSFTENLNFANFAFSTNKSDTNCIKKMRLYSRLFYLLGLIIFLLVPFSFVIVSFY